MTSAASTSFTVVFTVFVIAALVLLVVTIRFLVRQASASKTRWLAQQEPLRQAELGTVDDADEEDDLEEEPDEMTALVLAGGSTRGAIQIGMLQVLAEHGFVPDRIFGSSVGAINGVGFAADPTVRVSSA